ncbi:urea carboxylase-associated family protein [Galbibacter sp. BG1]|uniref:DUF1989 domain-containing protein n=1 Tax=Galbibacter sp. BG1 TaxID=1170699 RepID=UPI0015BCD006|nr:urea carboxylase-associated family protein [Galbibacter sp. BG1]QLE02850.1 urea carboxylase-associated family protein [Galbibacter sp. BG1]
MVQTIPKLSGDSFLLKKGELLKVIDPEGKQVSDMMVINSADAKEKLSSGKTLDYEKSLLITKGNFLWSNRSNKMLEIIEDTNGRNDFLLAPCDRKTFKHFYGMEEYHPSCMENLSKSLEPYGVSKDEIPTAFNIFMNVVFDESGSLKVITPTTKPGDHVIFRAEMDLIIALTACSAKDSNGGTFKPIQYELISEVNA